MRKVRKISCVFNAERIVIELLVSSGSMIVAEYKSHTYSAKKKSILICPTLD